MDVKFENLEKIDLILERLDKIEAKISCEKRWFNVKETSHYLGYSQEYIHKLKDITFILGKHYYKMNGKLLFDKYELDNWVISSNTLKKIDVTKIVDDILKDIL